MSVFKRIAEMLRDYGRWKGVMYINENGSENYIPVSKAIEIVNSAAEPQWIPCSERLPNFSPGKWRKVLVTLEDTAGKKFTTTAKYHEEYKEWYKFIDCRCHDFKVIAWMPLPEPYKGE